MNIRIKEIRHFGDVFGDPIFLDADDIEDVGQCPACNDADQQQLLGVAEGKEAPGIAVAQCGGCSHVYLSRRPSNAWYQRYYSEEWDTGRTSMSKDAPFQRAIDRSRKELRKLPLLRRLFRAARTLLTSPEPGPSTSFQRESVLSMIMGLGGARDMRTLPVGGKVLEIGSGYGGALAIFESAGLKAFGTEASTHRVQFCKAQGYHITQTPIDNLEAMKEHAPFDIVYSAHVVEHLLDPSAILRQVEPLIKDNGYIYFEVPNACVAESLIKLLHYPFHCHAFSAASMTRMLERFGFRPVRILMDVNLHVIARKGLAPFDFSQPTPVDARSLLRGDGAWLRDPGNVRIFFDDSDMRITREPSGEVLYARPQPYSSLQARVGRKPNYGREFSVEVEPSEPAWPVRWVHKQPRAPIWMKFQ